MKYVAFVVWSMLICPQSGNAQTDHSGITGKWKVLELVNMISFERSALEELKAECTGAIWKISKDSIVVLGQSTCDFSGCGKTDFKPLYLNVIKENKEMLKYTGQEIYEGKISPLFLKRIGYEKKDSRIKAYDAVCNISWGKAPLKIIPVNPAKLVFVAGAYFLIAERTDK